VNCVAYEPLSDSVRIKLSLAEARLWLELAEIAALIPFRASSFEFDPQEECPHPTRCIVCFWEPRKTELVHQIRMVCDAYRAELAMNFAEARGNWSVRFALRGRGATIHIDLPRVDLQDLSRLACKLVSFYHEEIPELENLQYGRLCESVSRVTEWVRCQQKNPFIPTTVLRTLRHTPEGYDYWVG
jgi:hypothetical protein